MNVLSGRKSTLAILLFLFSVTTLFAQNPVGEKSTQQIINEYKEWNGMKDDWANLNRFSEENSKLGSPAEGEKRVVFMGNSITEGWLQEYPEFFEGKPYVNRGIGGQTTPQMLIRFRQDVIDLEPEAVVILAGTNDIAGNTGPSTLKMIENNLVSMAQLARANDIKVILASILPAYDYPWRPGLEPAGKIITLNQRLRQFAEENGMTYLDFFSSMADDRNGMKAEYSEDEVHPNREAYKVMSELAEETIENVLTAE